MSMLAERKRKQKWSLNPRGKDWVQDANKFGQKMLEKMGWQQGKGLGAKEDGMTEHVKVSYKNDSKGMGYKETNDQWTEHETNFSALLESLAGNLEKPDEVKLQSLEKKSESSRVRVHYHKFTRGKDLSRYSEKDLANIFGKKSLKEEVRKEIVSDAVEKDDQGSQFLVNAGSMRDYFKRKLPNFGKNNGYMVGSNGVLKTTDSDTETETRPSFSFNEVEDNDEGSEQYVGFGFKNEVKEEETNKNPTFVSYVNEDNLEVDKKKKKKKRKVEEIEEATPKKKSKKGQEATIDSVGLSNPAFNPMCTPVKVEKHILTTIEETFSEEISEVEKNSVKFVETEVEVHDEGKYAKKKLKMTDQNEISLELSNESQKKKQKKKKKELCVENPGFNGSCNDSTDLSIVVEENPYEVQAPTKKKKKSLSGIKNLSCDEVSLDSEVSVKSRKKKKNEELCVENPGFNGSCDDSTDLSVAIEENPYEVQAPTKKKKISLSEKEISLDSQVSVDSQKKKQRKKKEELCVENPGFNGLCDDSTDFSVAIEENPYEVQVPAKKKKKKDKLAVENPNFNESDEISVESRHENNLYEVKSKKKIGTSSSSEDVSQTENTGETRKKKKRRKDEAAIENPCFNESIEESPIEENSYEVKAKKKKGIALDLTPDENSYEVRRKKKKKAKDEMAITNPAFSEAINNSVESSSEVGCTDFTSMNSPGLNNAFEVERKKKKSKQKENGVANPTLDLGLNSLEINVSSVIESDLMLNIVTTPISKPKTVISDETFTISKVSSAKRRKSVRFNDVTQEHIIPNNDDLRNLTDIDNRNELFDINTQVLENRGLDNLAFDRQRNRVDENVESISKKLESYQSEIENDINEEKMKSFGMDDVMVGEVGNPHGENEKLPDGTKLKFKHAHFLSTKTPIYQMDKVGPRKGYRHLIKGDIVVKFNNTNLHEINGYAIKSKGAVS